MKNVITYQKATEPTAFVTKSKQRVKQYDNNIIYLKNKEEFEIELFNPTQSKVLAKISLNGKSLGSGIILRPGERVFLERYFDEARKFLFETYNVDANDPNVKAAIVQNGSVEVEFYQEYVPCIYSSSTITYTPYYGNIRYNNAGYNTGIKTTTSNAKTRGFNDNWSNTLGVDLSGSGSFYCSTSSPLNEGVKSAEPIEISNCCAKVEETGRIEKGEVSDQSFVYDSTSFNSYYSWKTFWKILPDSQRPIYKQDLSVYCTKCGAKRKKSSHKFCPNCGQSFNSSM